MLIRFLHLLNAILGNDPGHPNHISAKEEIAKLALNNLDPDEKQAIAELLVLIDVVHANTATAPDSLPENESTEPQITEIPIESAPLAEIPGGVEVDPASIPEAPELPPQTEEEPISTADAEEGRAGDR